MSHTIIPKINHFGEAAAMFVCNEPPDAWCQHQVNVVDRELWEEPPDPLDCWFTILADGFAPFGKGGMYDGPPSELRPSAVEFTKAEGLGEDYCFWHYQGGAGGHDYCNVRWDD